MNEGTKAVLGAVADGCVSRTEALETKGGEVSENAKRVADLIDHGDFGCTRERVREILSIVMGEELPGGSVGSLQGCLVVRQVDGKDTGEPIFVARGQGYSLTSGYVTVPTEFRPATKREIRAFFDRAEENAAVTRAHVMMALEAVMAD